MQRHPSDLTDRIYEAAILPELWPETCDLISQEMRSYSTAVITISPNEGLRWVSSPRIAEQMEIYEKSGLAQRTERPKIGLQLAPGSFLRDIDLLAPEVLRSDPIRVELLEPIGLAWEMGAAFIEPSGTIMVFSLLAKTSDGPFDLQSLERANAIKGDLGRAAFLSTRLAFRQAQATTQTLAALGLPAAVVGATGDVMAMNDLMEGLAPRLTTLARNRLHFSDRQANAVFVTVLEQLRQENAPPCQSFPVAAQPDAPALVVHVVPVKRNARDIFTRSSAVVVVTPVGEVGPPDLKVICGLFDLTRAEARVAQEITIGRSVEEVAASMGTTVATIRTQLKSVYRKTGVNRQSQLVALLSGMRPITRT
ncbi:LuxR C-terminal-related transcriptional regulator [Rhizobium sp. RU36D]|uniref:helix-turn-helix transcriptional regulator n=1 Tax=Rhizobium sp. RU36D TaxID=1907415 RepID=UPI0009D86274|nr:LuxR C-terminal-related transcriptional regulator [Rhizobium sp. RU36D]SMC99563.1 DNA-binding transcriptional regulator, CsgD family [Rhizobium sp. RU36D]